MQWIWLSICLMLHDNIRLKLDTSQLLKLYSKPLSSLQLQHFLLVTSLSPLLTISNPGCQTDIKEKPSDGYSSWQTAMRKKTPMLTLRETGSWSPKFLAQSTHTGTEAMATAVRHSEPMSDQERWSSSQSELLLVAEFSGTAVTPCTIHICQYIYPRISQAGLRNLGSFVIWSDSPRVVPPPTRPSPVFRPSRK